MNNLHRDIQPGEIVVIAEKWMMEEYTDLKYRLFECDGTGFGAKHHTVGSAIFGKFVFDGKKCRMEGDMIDKAETEIY